MATTTTRRRPATRARAAKAAAEPEPEETEEEEKPARRPARSRKRTASANGRPRVQIKVEDLSEFDESKNILIYGDSGVGKTVLAGGLPNAVFLAIEPGTISAKRFGSKAKLIRIGSWEEFLAALEYLQANPKMFDWVIVDSLHKLQQICIAFLLKENVEQGKKNADIDVPQIQDHQKWQNQFMRYVGLLNELPQHVLYTATSMRIESVDEDGEPVDIVLPAIQGKAKQGYEIAQRVCAEMSSVYYYTIQRKKGGKLQRIILTQKSPPFFAKCRYDALPARLLLKNDDNTVLARMMEKIDSGESREPEPEPEEDPDDIDLEEDDEPDDEDLDEDEGSDDEDLDEDDEPEEKPRARSRKPAASGTRRKSSASSRTRKPARTKPEPEPEDDDLDLDDLDDEDDDY